jgi:hypothetical protein
MAKTKKHTITFYKRYTFNDEMLEILKIPKIELIDDHLEEWAVAIFNKHEATTKQKRYMVSTYGRVYDLLESVIIKVSNHHFFKSSVSPYKCVVVESIDDDKPSTAEYLLHRLVMFSFVKPDPKRPLVNHIDGNPSHNYLWNLEWTNVSENYIHALKTGLKKEQYGEERSNAKWTDDEVRIICQMMEDGHKATFIYNALLKILDNNPKVQYERVRTLYKHIKHKTHWTTISKDFDIDFTPFNYAKEKGNVQKVLDNKSKETIIFDYRK